MCCEHKKIRDIPDKSEQSIQILSELNSKEQFSPVVDCDSSVKGARDNTNECERQYEFSEAIVGLVSSSVVLNNHPHDYLKFGKRDFVQDHKSDQWNDRFYEHDKD